MAEAAGTTLLSKAQTVELTGVALEVPNIKSSDTVIKKAAEKYREGDIDTTLAIISGDVVPHSEEDVNKSLLSNLSTNRKSTGERDVPTDIDQNRRLREAKAIADRTRMFLETGTITPEFQSQVAAFIEKNVPVFKDLIDEAVKNGADRALVVETLAKKVIGSKSFRDKLRTDFTTRLDPNTRQNKEKDVIDLEGELKSLEAKLKGVFSDTDIEAIEIEITNAQTELTAKGVDLADYANHQRTLTDLEPRITDYKAIVTDDPQKVRFNTIQRQIDALDGIMAAAPGPTDPSYTDAYDRKQQLETIEQYQVYKGAKERVKKYDAAKTYFSDITADLAKKAAVENYGKAVAKLAKAKEKSGEQLSEAEQAEIRVKIEQKKIELADSRELLEASMIGYFRDVTHMPEDAAESAIQSMFSNIRSLYTEQSGVKDIEDADIKTRVLSKIPNLWKTRETDRKSGVTYWRASRNATRDLMNSYLNSGVSGLEASMIGSIMPGGRFDAAYLTGRGFSAEETTYIREQFKTKTSVSEFFKENGDNIGANVVGDFMISGGRFTREILESFVLSDSGKKIIETAKARNVTARADLEAIVGKDVTSALDNLKNTSGEFIKKNWAKIGIALLLLLLGGGLLGAKA